MEIRKMFRLTALAVCCLSVSVFTACSDDDDNEVKSLKFSPAKVETSIGTTDTVLVKGGTQPYTATISAADTAIISIKADSLFITGKGKGKATVIVTDNNKLTGSLPVTVK